MENKKVEEACPEYDVTVYPDYVRNDSRSPVYTVQDRGKPIYHFSAQFKYTYPVFETNHAG